MQGLQLQNDIHNERLEDDELAFLRRKEQKERKQYFKSFRLLMILSFVIPFAGAWYQAMANVPAAFSAMRYFMGVSVLLSLSFLGTYLSYRLHLRKVQHDIRGGTKTVEISHVTRKQYMPQNNSYYFYLDSKFRLSIEVSQDEFYNYSEGDEISIEYTTHGKIYLGHF
jgi:hypothetical protein